jgi:predicted Zn-dependent protease with MMP-like domain
MDGNKTNENMIAEATAAERIEALAGEAAADIAAKAEAFRNRLEALRAGFRAPKPPAKAEPAPVGTVEYAQPELVRAAEEAILAGRTKPVAPKQAERRHAPRSAEGRNAWRENKLEQIRRLSDECVQELPQEFLRRLNGGVALTDRVKKHAESDPRRPLLILGEYRTDPNLGRSIMLYGGSIIRAYGHLPEAALKDELRRIIRHEFTHHIESLSGARDLEIWDEIRLEEYREGGMDEK